MRDDFDEIDGDNQTIPGDALETKAPEKVKSDQKSEQPAKRLSIREAIADAVKEKDDTPKEVVKKHEKSKSDGKEVRREREVKAEVDSEEADKEVDDKKEVDKKEVDKEVKVETKPKVEPKKVPAAWTKRSEAFGKLPDELQDELIRREDEISKGFKEYGEKTAKLKEYDDLVTRYVPDSQKYGATQVQVVERTLQWLQAISNPNRSQAANHFMELAKQFGVDEELKRVYGQPNQSTTATTGAPDTTQPVTSIPELDSIKSEIAQLKAEKQQAEREAAQRYLADWAKGKPHFDKVRAVMQSMLSAPGVIPLKDGKLDLDEAYNRAVRQDPELYAEMLAEELAKKEAGIREEVAKKEQQQREQVEKAKKAGTSLKPAAVSAATKSSVKTPQRRQSISSSIRDAIKEVRGN